MNIKYLYIPSKIYIALLVVAIMLLLITTSLTYRQIKLTQKSAESVVQTLEVYNGLSDLSAHYIKAGSEEFRSALLNDKNSNTVFEAYKQEGIKIIDSIKILTQDNELHKTRIIPLSALLNSLYSQLYNLDAVNIKENNDVLVANHAQRVKINKTISDIDSIKTRMLVDEERLMKERETSYALHKMLTPSMLLLLAFFALLVFTISFFRIYNNKLKIKKSEAFLKNVLATTDNIVNYYEPVFNNENEVIDFKIIYANDCNRDYLGLEPEYITNKSVLEIYPLHNSKKELEELIESFEKKTKVIFDREIIIKGKKMWFHSLATPLYNGILVTSRNSTAEEESNQMESALKNRLKNQNKILLENRALLTNVVTSIPHVVMHFKSIRDAEGEIIDFEVLFVNDRIIEITGDLPKDIENKKLSEVFPKEFKSGVFQHSVQAIETGKNEEYELSYDNNGKLQWFKGSVIKLEDGVTITTRDVTLEKEKALELINLNEELIIQNSILTDAEQMANIGNFIWYLDTDTSNISDNFYTILGYEPKEFEPSLVRFKEFVHPEDLEEYTEISEKALNKFQVTKHTYRVITKQGTVKHLTTNGQFIQKNGKMVMIGVVQDVTQTIDSEAMLLKSNLELKNRNHELESFNRVASHDLQEPLRKIQLFSLRIQDTEAKNFSNKSAEYFGKVIKAVNRMQSLIDNLLAYSKINISKKDFEEIDLNQLLIKIKDDITTTISDSNTELTSESLPVIEGVTFQIEQLFTNLITNAIKYRRDNESPLIKIAYTKVSNKGIPELNSNEDKLYHKISFIDNGIGFNQQYAEKIFEVFQRLHQKNEYSGTGIGLAICKKIVENHNGCIKAIGTEGEGSQFIIYLPV